MDKKSFFSVYLKIVNKKLPAISLIALGILLVPSLISAQDKIGGTPGVVGPANLGLAGMLAWLLNMALHIVWLIAVTVTIIMFVVAGLKFLTAQGNEQQIAEARRAVLWGVAGVAVIIIAWSIILIIRTQLSA